MWLNKLNVTNCSASTLSLHVTFQILECLRYRYLQGTKQALLRYKLDLQRVVSRFKFTVLTLQKRNINLSSTLVIKVVIVLRWIDIFYRNETFVKFKPWKNYTNNRRCRQVLLIKLILFYPSWALCIDIVASSHQSHCLWV